MQGKGEQAPLVSKAPLRGVRPRFARARPALLAAAVLTLAPLAPTPAAADHGPQGPPLKVRFAPEKDYGPFIYEDSDGVVRGLSMDMLAALAEHANLQLEMLPPRPLNEILAAAQRGEVDLISSLRPTPERAKVLGFTRAYATVPAVLVTLPTGQQPTLLDFQGRPVAVGRGYAVEAFAREKYPAVQWVSVNDDAEGLQKLRLGQVSAVVADVASVHFVADRLGLDAFKVHAGIGFEYPLSFAFLKSRPDIGERLEEGLRLLPEAQRQTLRRQWLEGRQQRGEDPRARWLIRLGTALAALAVLGLAVAWWRQRESVHDAG